MAIKRRELMALNGVTVFAVSDASFFGGSDGFRYDFDKRMRLLVISRVPFGTVMETMSQNKTIVFGEDDGKVTVNGFNINVTEVYHNRWIAVVSILRSLDGAVDSSDLISVTIIVYSDIRESTANLLMVKSPKRLSESPRGSRNFKESSPQFVNKNMPDSNTENALSNSQGSSLYIPLQTINSLDSWNGGVLVVVSGSVKAKEFTGRRKFVQSFLLAPQGKGFFVLNDIFQLLSEEVVYQHTAPVLQENIVDYQQPTPAYLDDRVDYQHSAPLYSDNNVDYQHSAPTYSENLSDYQHHPGQMLHDDRDYQHQAPVYADNIADSHPTNHSPLSESPDVPSYEVEASEHLNSVHIEGNGHVDDYGSYDQQQQEEPVVEYAKAAPVEDLTASHNVVNHQQESLPAAEEPIVETQKFSYASIESTANLLMLKSPKRLSESPRGSRIFKEPSPQFVNKNMPDSNTENALSNSLGSSLYIPQNVDMQALETLSAVGNETNVENAEACAKELDDLASMLKKKHEEAKEILVRAVVNNNKLLMLNHPMYEEKISSQISTI